MSDAWIEQSQGFCALLNGGVSAMGVQEINGTPTKESPTSLLPTSLKDLFEQRPSRDPQVFIPIAARKFFTAAYDPAAKCWVIISALPIDLSSVVQTGIGTNVFADTVIVKGNVSTGGAPLAMCSNHHEQGRRFRCTRYAAQCLRRSRAKRGA